MARHNEEIGPAEPEFPEDLLASVVTARACGIPAELIARAVRSLTVAARKAVAGRRAGPARRA